MSNVKNILSWLTKRFSKKTLAMVAALTLAMTGVASSTLAWLIDQTPEVTNTFTYGDINIELDETDTNTDGDNDPNTNEYPMMPGTTIEKDPVVTVLADSEDSWLFVKLEESDNFDDFLTYEMAEGWTALPGFDGVYYMAVDASDADQEFPVLLNNQVQVLPDVTKEDLNALDANGASNYPTLKITAYAIQRDAAIDGIDDPATAYQLILDQNN